MSRIDDYRRLLERRKGKKEQLERDLLSTQKSRKESKRSLFRHEEALEIIREVGIRTQQQLQYHISDITTLALDAVFPEPYELVAEFVDRRNKSECDLLFKREDVCMDPLTASGGGAVDVAAFALRVASWSMQRPRSRNVLVLDEPMRFVSRNLQERASQMIKEISEKMGIQFIIITHEETLASFADKAFEVELKRGVSKVTEI